MDYEAEARKVMEERLEKLRDEYEKDVRKVRERHGALMGVLEARDRFPDLVAHAGFRWWGTALGMVLKVEEYFAEVQPVLDFLEFRGWEVEGVEDQYSGREVKLWLKGPGPWVYMEVEVPAGSECEQVEETVEVTRKRWRCADDAVLESLAETVQ